MPLKRIVSGGDFFSNGYFTMEKISKKNGNI